MKYYLLNKIISARTHFALSLLMLILQRSPLLKLLAYARNLQASAPVARIIQSFALPVAVMATPHAISGASTSSYDVEYINTPELKVGVEAAIKFSNTIAPQSWSLTGTLPPGMRITDLRLRKSLVDGVIATSIGIITGTPTQAGTYDIVLTPWSNADGTGDTAPEPNPGALRLSLIVVPDKSAPLVAPEISFTREANSVTLTWQVEQAQGFDLKASKDLQSWILVSQLPSVSNGEARITFPGTSAEPSFYRLEPATNN